VKLVFLGTPEFAVPSLEALVEAGHEVLAVYTQPDRPAGRKQELKAPPVKEAALRLGLEVRQPERIRHCVDELAAMKPDAMAVVGYGQIIPQAIIDIPPLGILNVHASLLPKYRGAAPIQWAIANGETVTGVTIMRIDAGLDTGDILLQEATEIGAEETAPELAARLAPMGARLLVRALEGLAEGSIRPVPQDHAQATLAPILKREDGLVDFRWPAAKIACRARGFQPWPGAWTWWRGQRFFLWKCRPAQVETPAVPGKLFSHGKRLFAACGQGEALELVEVQAEGRKRMDAAAFLNGYRLAEKDLLGEIPQ
jgi:methionyl-tRNA formyltransferase